MTSRLRKVFIDNLKSADWMDYRTKQSAKQKVETSQKTLNPKFIRNNVLGIERSAIF